MRRRRSLTKAFGIILRAMRTEAGLSQERLAFRAGIHPTYLSQLERGVKSPTLDVVAALAKALHLPAHLLIHTAETGEK